MFDVACVVVRSHGNLCANPCNGWKHLEISFEIQKEQTDIRRLEEYNGLIRIETVQSRKKVKFKVHDKLSSNCFLSIFVGHGLITWRCMIWSGHLRQKADIWSVFLSPSLFQQTAGISASSSSDCGTFCDMHRFTQTGTCIFYIVAHSHVPTVWHSASWEEFILHLYSIFIV